ncbi:AAA family ATPase [Frigoribacterium sp. UYMn621]|uniref:AAA family ATPase n=1 Tax=Frigoribacterium sp. UYMn621 TaxID=3156343 RepID=UPI003394A9DE
MNATPTATAPQPVALPKPAFAGMFQKKADVGPPRSLLLYGATGTRKTSTVGRMMVDRPEFTKMLIIDIDNGTEVFANDPEVLNLVNDEDMGMAGEKTINIIRIDKTSEDAYGQLRYYLGERDLVSGTFRRGAVFGQGYDVIVVDTANVMQEVAVQWLKSNTWNDKGKLDTRGAWGSVSEWTSDIAWAMQNDPASTGIWLAHSSEGTDEGGQYSVKPKFQGSVKDSIAAIPSVVAYLEKVKHPETGEISISATVDGDVIVSKNRYMLPNRIENFALSGLYAMLAERREVTPRAQTPSIPVATQPEAPASVYI